MNKETQQHNQKIESLADRFGPRLTKEQVDRMDVKEQALLLWQGWKTPKKRKGGFAALNALICAIGYRSGVLEKKESARPDYSALNSKVSRFHRIERLFMPVLWLGQHIDRHWTNLERTTVMRALDIAEFFHLFRRESHYDPSIRKYTPSMFSGFSSRRWLLIYEALEELYIETYGWEEMPAHKGAGVKHIYNAVIRAGMGFRRQVDPEVAPAQDNEEAWQELREKRDRWLLHTYQKRMGDVEEVMPHADGLLKHELEKEKTWLQKAIDRLKGIGAAVQDKMQTQRPKLNRWADGLA